MTDPRIQAALGKLEHGGWSLTVNGFARRAVGTKSKETDKELRDLMMETGLPHRRITYGGAGFDVWDYDAP